MEVVAFGHAGAQRRLCDVLAEFGLAMPPRLRKTEGAPVVTDGGNPIYDIACVAIPDPATLGAALKSVTGVVEHDLLLDLADEALIGGDGGVERLQP